MASLIILVGTARPTVSLNTKGDSFGGAPKNKLLVAEYSGRDDLIALAPGTDSIPRGNVSGHFRPYRSLGFDRGHQKNKGNLYVAELISGGTSGQISLLKLALECVCLLM